MPRAGYRSVTVREETFRILREVAMRRGISVAKLLDEVAIKLASSEPDRNTGLKSNDVESRLEALENEVERLRKVLQDAIVRLDLLQRRVIGIEGHGKKEEPDT
ncbi:MAG: hypothetical protein F7B17_08430 [Desulfurococcales archaeon]|nr:hypothetical protein [Desulfurococcales archaeon]